MTFDSVVEPELLAASKMIDENKNIIINIAGIPFALLLILLFMDKKSIKCCTTSEDWYQEDK